MPRKKFKETRIGLFLKEKAPMILDKIGDVLPDKGVLGLVKNLIDKDETITTQDKEQALKLLEMDMDEIKEVTKRWEADMNSDSWLSKNSRPIVLLALIGMLFVFMALDSFKIQFDIKESWIILYETILVTVIIAYFGSRGVEKYQSIRNSKK